MSAVAVALAQGHPRPLWRHLSTTRWVDYEAAMGVLEPL